MLEQVQKKRKNIGIGFTLYAVLFLILVISQIGEVSQGLDLEKTLTIVGIILITLILLVIAYFVGGEFGRFIGIYGTVMSFLMLLAPLYLFTVVNLFDGSDELFYYFGITCVLIIILIVFSVTLYQVCDSEVQTKVYALKQQGIVDGQPGVPNLYMPYNPSINLSNPYQYNQIQYNQNQYNQNQFNPNVNQIYQNNQANVYGNINMSNNNANVYGNNTIPNDNINNSN